MAIVNLTQHPATAEQTESGVQDLIGETLAGLLRLLEFDDPPAADDLRQRADAVTRVAVASGAREAMVGCAPFLVEPLCQALRRAGLRPVFAFSRRVAEEQRLADGSVRKVSVFRHAGFVRPDDV